MPASMSRAGLAVLTTISLLGAVGCSDSGGPVGPGANVPNIAGTWDAVSVTSGNTCPFPVAADAGQVPITQTGDEIAMTFVGFVMRGRITSQGFIEVSASQSVQVEGVTVTLDRDLTGNRVSDVRIIGSLTTDVRIPATGESCTVIQELELTRG